MNRSTTRWSIYVESNAPHSLRLEHKILHVRRGALRIEDWNDKTGDLMRMICRIMFVCVRLVAVPMGFMVVVIMVMISSVGVGRMRA